MTDQPDEREMFPGYETVQEVIDCLKSTPWRCSQRAAATIESLRAEIGQVKSCNGWKRAGEELYRAMVAEEALTAANAKVARMAEALRANMNTLHEQRERFRRRGLPYHEIDGAIQETQAALDPQPAPEETNDEN